MTNTSHTKEWLTSIISEQLMSPDMSVYLSFRAKDYMPLMANTTHGIFSTKVGTSTLVLKAHGDEKILIALSDYPVITLSDDFNLDDALLKLVDSIGDDRTLGVYGAQLCKGIHDLEMLSKSNSERNQATIMTLDDELKFAKKNFNTELVRVLNEAIVVPGSSFVFSPNQSNIYRRRLDELLPVYCNVSHKLEDGTVAITLTIGELGTPECHAIKSRMGITLLKLCDKYHRALFALAISNETMQE